MKNPSILEVTARWLWTLACVAVLLVLGCTKEPDSTAAKAGGNTNPASSNSGEKATASKAVGGAPTAKTDGSKVDVGEFLAAALDGKLEFVRQAIDGGVAVDAVDEEKRTALLFASFNGHTPVVKLLLDNGASLTQRDAVGRTALMFASTGDNAATVELLLEKGADVNAADTDEGFTALMHAAAEGHVDVVKVLLQHHANPELRDADGDSALDFAIRNRHGSVVELLKK